MARPSPAPPVVRVRLGSARAKLSKAWSENSGGKPGPSSMTRTVGVGPATTISTVEPSGRVADGVVDEVADHPADRRRVAVDRAARRVSRRCNDTLRAAGRRAEGLDRLVGELGHVDGFGAELEPSRLDAGEQEQVVDERAERLDVARHRPQVAVRVGGDAVGQRLDRRPQRAERRAQVVADAGQHGAALLLERRPLALEGVEPLGELVERLGDLAQLVGAAHTRAHGAVAGLERLTVDSRRRVSRPSGAEATRASTVANTAVVASTPTLGADLAGVEDHQPGEEQRGDGADGQRGDGDGEDQVAQRAGAAGDARAAPARRRPRRRSGRRPPAIVCSGLSVIVSRTFMPRTGSPRPRR